MTSARGLVCVLAAGLLLGGCSAVTSRVEALPRSDEEWTRPLAELEQTYPDLVKFSRWYRRVADLELFGPSMEEVTEYLGEPTVEGAAFSFWNLKALTGSGGLLWTVFEPNAVWTWRKGGYLIEAIVTYAIERGYEPELFYLDISPLPEGAPPTTPPSEASLVGLAWLPPAGVEILETRGPDGVMRRSIRPLSVAGRFECRSFSSAGAYKGGEQFRVRGRCPRCDGLLDVPALTPGRCGCCR